jgi:hypothetical protein
METYPEQLSLPLNEHETVLKTVQNGGYKYNNFGEPCYDEDDDGEDDDCYESLATQEEIEQSIHRIELYRGVFK